MADRPAFSDIEEIGAAPHWIATGARPCLPQISEDTLRPLDILSGRLVSLWEVLVSLGPYGYRCVEAVRWIAEHRTIMGYAKDYWSNPGSAGLDAILDNLAMLAQELDLTAVSAQVVRVRHALQFTRSNPGDSSTNVTRGHLDDLLSRIEDELKARRFMYVPPSRVERYQRPGLFGPEVNVRFPDMADDIEEAGSCLAVKRYTATVFHLMRIMEGGVRSLGVALNRKIDVTRSWESVSKDVNEAIKALPTATQAERERRDMLMGAHAHLNSVRTVWRNPTMHPAQSYNEDQAEDIFVTVRIFIRYLAGII